MEQGKVIRIDPLEAAASAWRELITAIGPISFDFSPGNASANTGLINRFLESGKFSMAEPFVVQLITWLSEYERHNVQVPEARPADVLRHLMDSNQLKQADLSAELGGQSVVSAILSGRREINVRQARALAARFGVSAAVFIAAADAAPEVSLDRKFTQSYSTRVEAIDAAQVVPHYLNETHVALYQ